MRGTIPEKAKDFWRRHWLLIGGLARDPPMEAPANTTKRLFDYLDDPAGARVNEDSLIVHHRVPMITDPVL